MELNLQNQNKFYSAFNKKPTIIWYYATWCGHCTTFEPVWKSFTASCKKKYPSVKLVKIESELMPSLKFNPNVAGFPTVKFYNKGSEVENSEFRGSRDSESLLDYVKTHIQDNKINLDKKKSLKKKTIKKRKSLKKKDNYIVFGGKHCIYCKLTENLLKEKGEKYKYYDINKKQGKEQLKKHINKVPKLNRSTIPIIFKNGKYVEGYTGLLKHF